MYLFDLPEEMLVFHILPALEEEERQILRMTSSWFARVLKSLKVDICRFAALKGHLGVLQWARANGAPWDEWVCADAAASGNLEVLQWVKATEEELCSSSLL